MFRCSTRNGPDWLASIAKRYKMISSTNCKPPLCRIPSRLECNVAVQNLSLSNGSAYISAAPHQPSGCWIAQDGHLRFNPTNGNLSQRKENVICQPCSPPTATTSTIRSTISQTITTHCQSPMCALSSLQECEAAAVALSPASNRQHATTAPNRFRPEGCWVSRQGHFLYNPINGSESAGPETVLCKKCTQQ